MDEFYTSDTSLIVGICLLILAAGDYVFMRYFAKLMTKNDPLMEGAMRPARKIAPYWIAACTVAGLYLIMKYVELQPTTVP